MATIKETMSQLMKDGGQGGGESCPLATQDITINLKNRGKAIDSANYGPENPDLPNVPFWKKKADEWKVTIEEAKQSRCGNCAAFNQDDSMLSCIEKGIGDEGDPWAVIEAGDLGYCEIFDFKCASSRTCNAWVAEAGKDEYQAGDNSAMEGEDMEDKPMLVIKIGGRNGNKT